MSPNKGQVKHEGSYEFAFIPGNADYLLLSHFGSVASVEKTDAGVYATPSPGSRQRNP